MRLRPVLRTLSVLLIVCAFGALDAMIKGQHGGTRDAVGNISAPWLLVPLLSAAALAPRRLALGALGGVVSTVVAPAGYTVVRTLRGFQTGHPHGASAMVTSSLQNRWFLLGVVGGAALGAVGSRLAVHRQWAVVAVVVASVLAMEPAARVVYAIATGEPAGTLVPNPVVWTAEILCGCVGGLAASLRVLRQRQTPISR
ncbi:MAG TPA: DUF6518 family protein [Acidimicrobiales bacterium]